MLHLRKLLTFLLILCEVFADDFKWISLEPTSRYFLKGNSVILKCDTKNESGELFLYANDSKKNITVEILNKNDQSIEGRIDTNSIIGRMTVLCIRDGRLIGMREYDIIDTLRNVFNSIGYPKIQCQDFTENDVACCITPSDNKIIDTMELFSTKDLKVQITMFNYENYKSIETNELVNMGMVLSNDFKSDSNCFIVKLLFVPDFSISIFYEAVFLDNRYIYNRTFTRLDIIQPGKPTLVLMKQNFSLQVSMRFSAMYNVTINCHSSFPIVINETKYKVFSDLKTIVDFSSIPWIPYSFINCIAIMELYKIDKNFNYRSSLPAQIKLQIPSQKPNIGPNLTVEFDRFEGEKFINFIVYIIDIPDIDKNGKIMYYQYSCDACYNQKKLMKIYNTHLNIIKFEQVYINAKFNIGACNDKGCTFKTYHFFDSYVETKMFLHDFVFVRVTNQIYWWYHSQRLLKENINKSLLEYTNNSIKEYDLPNNKSGVITVDSIRTAQYAISVNNLIVTNWSNCYYLYDKSNEGSNSKLKKLSVITHEMECDLSSCVLKINFKRPPCDKFNDFYISQIIVEINNKNETKSLLTQNEHFEVELPFPIYLKYSLNIYIGSINKTSKYVLFDTINARTTLFGYPIIIIIIFIFILFVILVCCRLKTKIRRFKKKLFDKRIVPNNRRKHLPIVYKVKDPINKLSENKTETYSYENNTNNKASITNSTFVEYTQATTAESSFTSNTSSTDDFTGLHSNSSSNNNNNFSEYSTNQIIKQSNEDIGSDYVNRPTGNLGSDYVERPKFDYSFIGVNKTKNSNLNDIRDICEA